MRVKLARGRVSTLARWQGGIQRYTDGTQCRPYPIQLRRHGDKGLCEDATQSRLMTVMTWGWVEK